MPAATNSADPPVSKMPDQVSLHVPSNAEENPLFEEVYSIRKQRSAQIRESVPPPPPVPPAWPDQPAAGGTRPATVEKESMKEKSSGGDRGNIPSVIGPPPAEPGIDVAKPWTKANAQRPIWETISSPSTPEKTPPIPDQRRIDRPDPSTRMPERSSQFDRNGRVTELTSANFDQALREAKGPVLVDFSASWCGPCRNLAPKLDQLAREYGGKASVFKVDVDRNPDLAARFGVQGVPALKVFENGRIVEQASGDRPAQALRGMLDRHMLRPPLNPEISENVGNQPRSNRLGRIKEFINGLSPFSQREKDAAMSSTPYEQGVIDSLNRERVRLGMNALEFDPRLKLAALKKAENANHRYDRRTDLHNSGPPGFRTPQECFAQVGFNDYRECANTLAGGDFGPMFGPEALTQNWLQSDSHARILLSQADVVGIAVVGDKAFINVSSRRNSRPI